MLATPAISDGRLFIRTTSEVLAFGNRFAEKFARTGKRRPSRALSEL